MSGDVVLRHGSIKSHPGDRCLCPMSNQNSMFACLNYVCLWMYVASSFPQTCPNSLMTKLRGLHANKGHLTVDLLFTGVNRKYLTMSEKCHTDIKKCSVAHYLRCGLYSYPFFTCSSLQHQAYFDVDACAFGLWHMDCTQFESVKLCYLHADWWDGGRVRLPNWWIKHDISELCWNINWCS